MEAHAENKLICQNWDDEFGQSQNGQITFADAVTLLTDFAVRNRGEKITIEVNGQVVTDNTFDHDIQLAVLVAEQFDRVHDDTIIKVFSDNEGMEFYL